MSNNLQALREKHADILDNDAIKQLTEWKHKHDEGFQKPVEPVDIVLLIAENNRLNQEVKDLKLQIYQLEKQLVKR